MIPTTEQVLPYIQEFLKANPDWTYRLEQLPNADWEYHLETKSWVKPMHILLYPQEV